MQPGRVAALDHRQIQARDGQPQCLAEREYRRLTAAGALDRDRPERCLAGLVDAEQGAPAPGFRERAAAPAAGRESWPTARRRCASARYAGASGRSSAGDGSCRHPALGRPVRRAGATPKINRAGVVERHRRRWRRVRSLAVRREQSPGVLAIRLGTRGPPGSRQHRPASGGRLGEANRLRDRRVRAPAGRSGWRHRRPPSGRGWCARRRASAARRGPEGPRLVRRWTSTMVSSSCPTPRWESVSHCRGISTSSAAVSALIVSTPSDGAQSSRTSS